MFAPGVIRMTTARAASAASYAATRQRASQRALVSAFLHADAIVRVPTSLARTSFSTTSAARNASSRTVRSIGTPAVARASGLRAAWRLVPGTLSRADGLRAVSIRCLCASAKSGNAEASAAGKGEEGGKDKVDGASGEGADGEDPTARPMRLETEPQDNRPVSIVKTTLGFFLFCGAVYALWQTFKVLNPGKMSTNSFFSRCSDVVKSDPEIVNRFGGDIKTYGADFNQRREGRRFHIPEYRYKKDDVDYLRIVFNMEGPSGMKGKVFAEMRSDQKDKFHYLIVQKLNTGEVITIQDNRAPEKPKHVRQSDVAIALQALRATLYGRDGEEDTVLQKRELGESINLIRYIKCDENPYECTSNGVQKTPSWTIEGQLHEGFLELEKLEKIADGLKHRTMVTADS